MKTPMFLLSLVLSLPGSVQAGSSWQEEWERILSAAKKEGKVTVIADVTADIRDSLTTAFQGKYGIPVEYFGVMGREISPRVSAERKAGRYLWDVYVHGTTTGLTAMVPLGAFDPLEPALVFPDIKDPKNWRGGGLEFVDSGRQLLVTSVRQRGIIFINPNLVNPKEFKSYKDLLHPKWRGKIAMDDPTRAGPGQATFTFFYIHPDLGPDFIRALAKQQIAVLRDYGQEVDAVGQGRFPVLIGTADFAAFARIRQGVPVTIVDPAQLKEGSDLSSGNGAVALFNQAPHPNAAKAYINWFLSREGQTVFARGTGYVSARLMGPTSALGPIDAQLFWQGKRFSADALLEGMEKIKKEVVDTGVLNKAYIPILQGISPGELQSAQNALDFATTLVTQWLVQYKFKSWTHHSSTDQAVTDEEKKARAKEIAAQLCDHRHWLTHGRSIKLDDLKSMRLLVTDYSQQAELAAAITRYYALLQMTFATNLYKIYETPDTQIVKFLVPQVPTPAQSPNVVIFDLQCHNCKTSSKIQADLGTKQPLQPGCMAFPQNNKFQCPKCGVEHDLTDARRQLEAQAKKPVVS